MRGRARVDARKYLHTPARDLGSGLGNVLYAALRTQCFCVFRVVYFVFSCQKL